MLTEVSPVLYNVLVQGRVVIPNLPSRSIAEGQVFNLPPDQRALAEIVPVTADGRQMLLG